MRAVVQKVGKAKVVVDKQVVGEIKAGFLILLGVGGEDSEKDALYLAEKIGNLRIFPDGEGKMNLSLQEVAGEALVVSQFTLYGDCRKGRRPSFSQAASAGEADRLYQYFVQCLESQQIPVETGVFQAHMEVSLVNDGPVTLLLDSKGDF